MTLPKIPTTVKLIAADLLRLYPDLKPRMGKALDLIESGRMRFAFHTTNNEAVYSVRSSDQKTSYVVEARRCSCPAHVNPRTVCYHRIARGIITIKHANETRVAFDEAIAAESDLTPPAAPVEESAPALEMTQEPPQLKRVQSAGMMRGPLTIRESLDALGRRLREVRVTLIAAKG